MGVSKGLGSDNHTLKCRLRAPVVPETCFRELLVSLLTQSFLFLRVFREFPDFVRHGAITLVIYIYIMYLYVLV